MNRRDFLKQGLTVSAGLALGGLPKFAPFANANDAKWRTFEVTTRIDVADPVGAVRAWVPVPLMTNTDYFKREPDSWTGNYKTVRAAQTDKVGTGLVFAEWPAGEKSPTVEVKSRFMTQDRWVDLSQKPNPGIKENKATLDYFRKPSKYIRTDGIDNARGVVTQDLGFTFGRSGALAYLVIDRIGGNRLHGDTEVAPPGFRFCGLEIDQGIRSIDRKRLSVSDGFHACCPLV